MYPIISITICYFLLLFTIYHNHLLYCNFLPFLSRITTECQTKPCSPILGRQITIVYYQNLEAIGQAITDAAFYILTLQSQQLTSTDKPRKCVLFLQSTPPQNWILLSVYQNRSGSSYEDLCYIGEF